MDVILLTSNEMNLDDLVNKLDEIYTSIKNLSNKQFKGNYKNFYDSISDYLDIVIEYSQLVDESKKDIIEDIRITVMDYVFYMYGNYNVDFKWLQKDSLEELPRLITSLKSIT